MDASFFLPMLENEHSYDSICNSNNQFPQLQQLHYIAPPPTIMMMPSSKSSSTPLPTVDALISMEELEPAPIQLSRVSVVPKVCLGDFVTSLKKHRHRHEQTLEEDDEDVMTMLDLLRPLRSHDAGRLEDLSPQKQQQQQQFSTIGNNNHNSKRKFHDHHHFLSASMITDSHFDSNDNHNQYQHEHDTCSASRPCKRRCPSSLAAAPCVSDDLHNNWFGFEVSAVNSSSVPVEVVGGGDVPESFDLLSAMPSTHASANSVVSSDGSSSPSPTSTPCNDITSCAATSTSTNTNNNTTTKISAKQEEKWWMRYQELKEYHEQHGHCNVPHSYADNVPLAQWVKRQRHQMKLREQDRHNHLTPKRTQALISLGFCWDSHEALWEQRYQEMARYSRQHGHCAIPSRCKAQPELATWCKCQRRQATLRRQGRKSNITPERIERLNAIGFVWEPRANK